MNFAGGGVGAPTLSASAPEFMMCIIRTSGRAGFTSDQVAPDRQQTTRDGDRSKRTEYRVCIPLIGDSRERPA